MHILILFYLYRGRTTTSLFCEPVLAGIATQFLRARCFLLSYREISPFGRQIQYNSRFYSDEAIWLLPRVGRCC